MWGDVVLSLLFTLLSIVMYMEALTLPEGLFGTLGPGYFPKFVLGCLMAASGSLTLRLVIRAIAAHKEAAALSADGPGDKNATDGEETRSFYKKYRFVGLVFVAFFFYLYGMRWVGFLPATLLFMIGTMLMLAPAERNWGTVRVVLITSVLLTYGLYATFTYGFNVMLPAGTLF
jgi:hypothetical protein